MNNEQGLANSPKPVQVNESPKRPRITRTQIYRLKTPLVDYDQYVRTLGAFIRGKMPSLQPIANVAYEKGHQVESVEVDVSIQQVGERGEGEFVQDENKAVDWHNRGRMEITPQLAGPHSISGTEVIPTSNLLTPNQTTTVDIVEEMGIYPDQKPQPGDNILQFPQNRTQAIENPSSPTGAGETVSELDVARANSLFLQPPKKAA